MKAQFIQFVPNMLSTLRLVLACLFPFCPEGLWIWLILSSGFSDFLDGWVARRRHVESWQGGLIDAVADKAFMLIALITLICAGKFSPWWLPAVLARDLIVAITAAYALYCRSWQSFQQMEAKWSGKLATAGQFLMLVIVALFPELTGAIILFTVLLSIIAACHYGLLFIQALRHRAENK